MVKSCACIILLAFGVAQAFNNSLHGGSNFRPSAFLRSLNGLSTPQQSQRRHVTFLLSSPSDNDSPSSATIAVQKRRAFLTNFAATFVLPIIASTNPASVSAWGFPTNEKGPLVYGADDIMSPKEHGTTAMPVQESLRYGVSAILHYCQIR